MVYVIYEESCGLQFASFVKSSYFGRGNSFVSIYRTLSETDKLAPCNSRCHCSGRDYDPVCGVDKVSYFSPCHAGCMVQVKDKESMQKTNLLSIEKVGVVESMMQV